jgi:hypothetical protein
MIDQHELEIHRAMAVLRLHGAYELADQLSQWLTAQVQADNSRHEVMHLRHSIQVRKSWND